ncbi:histidine phosphatase family protein [Pseudomonas borbori]
MKRFAAGLLGLALSLCGGLLSSVYAADEAAAWDALRNGRAILLLRHASAPGFGDPADFRLDDCSSQRNLDARGREQARRWGELLRAQRFERLQLYSSRWCRARDTATQMDLGPVQPLPALDSFFATRARASQQTEELLEHINGLEQDATRVLVSHQVNITALTGIYPASGEGLILAVPLTSPATLLGRIAAP